MSITPQAQLLNVSEVAELLSLGKSSIWRHVSNGTLPKPIKICGATRWRKSDIETFIENAA